MNKFKSIISCLIAFKESFKLRYFSSRQDAIGFLGEGAIISKPSIISGRQNVYLGKHVNIDWNNVIYATGGKLIIGDYSGCAVGFTAVTGNHTVKPGEIIKDSGNGNLVEKDIVIEENVWIASNVTLLSGAHIGREAIVGAGSVVRNCNIPPYAIVIGNPAKVIGFKFSPKEIIEHEKLRYPEEKRLSLAIIEKNYDRYYKKKIKEIVNYVKL